MPAAGTKEAYLGMVERMDSLEQKVISMEIAEGEEEGAGGGKASNALLAGQ